MTATASESTASSAADTDTDAGIEIDTETDTTTDIEATVAGPPGTAADTEPYLLTGGSTGVLLLHGFTASPYGLRFLAEDINDAGHTVYVPRLAGHGTHYSDLRTTTWKDWYQSAVDGLATLWQEVETIFVAGHSMGGVLALRLAQEYRVQGVMVANTPIYLEGFFFTMIPITKIFMKYIVKSKRTLKREWSVDITYKKFPVNCIESLRRLVRLVKSDLDRVNAPTLIAQATRDELVPINSGQFIYDHIGSSEKVMHSIEHSTHYIEDERDRKLLGEWARQFIERAC